MDKNWEEFSDNLDEINKEKENHLDEPTKSQEEIQKEKRWEEFFDSFDEIVKAERDKFPNEFKNSPKTWDELLRRIDELPGDDPLTWYKYRENKEN